MTETDYKLAISRSLESFQEEQEFHALLTQFQKNEIAQKREIHVAGDGNCFFRCISIVCYDDQKYHALVRKQMIDFAIKNRTKFASSINIVGESFDSWIGKMQNPGNDEFGLLGEYADIFAVELISNWLERPILVQLEDVLTGENYTSLVIGENFTKSTIHLLLRGQHYSLLN